MARVSPDGKWLAYVSDESGITEVYVQAYPEPGGRWMVSSDGGARGAFRPVWRADGRELYYERDRSVMAVATTVTPDAGFSFGKPKPLFRVNVKSGQGAGLVVADNGEKLLTNELPPVDSGKAGARLIQNWAAELAGRVRCIAPRTHGWVGRSRPRSESWWADSRWTTRRTRSGSGADIGNITATISHPF